MLLSELEKLPTLPPSVRSAAEILRGAREMIADRKHWVKGTRHQRALIEVSPYVRPEAPIPEFGALPEFVGPGTREYVDQFCAIGAVEVIVKGDYQLRHFAPMHVVWRQGEEADRAVRILHGVAHDNGYSSIEVLNDRTDHPTVLAAFDEAIRRAEASEPPKVVPRKSQGPPQIKKAPAKSLPAVEVEVPDTPAGLVEADDRELVPA
jgi:hypothetical protein